MSRVKKRAGFRILTGFIIAIVMALSSVPVYADFIPIDYALNSTVGSIKTSSIRAGSKPENVFKAGISDYWDVDQSQSTSASVSQGKNQFWIAVDLKEQKDIFQFVVNFQTNFTQLKQRASQYRIEYTNDTDKWSALSTTTIEGSGGLANYNKPVGWTTVVTQNTADLVDGNGNKTMTYTLDNMINARYVMLTGEMIQGASFIRIYNFMANGKQEIDPKPPVVYPTENIADILPVYSGMSQTIGRPALVELNGNVPKFTVKAKKDIVIGGVLKDPGGNPIYSFPQQNLGKDALLEITPSATASLKGTYVMNFNLSDNGKQYYDSYYFTAVTGSSAYNDSTPYPAVDKGSDGKLVYFPDYKGNRVIDYSDVGYKGGGVAIPNVPVKIILEPIPGNGDDYTRIQNAIDALSRIAPDANGFRGAILLKAGTYRTSSTLKISASGIVIKGEGNGMIDKNAPAITQDNWYDYAQSENPESDVTKIVATWKSLAYDKSTAIFNVAGGRDSVSEAAIHVVDQYVPAGAHTFRLESVNGLNAGDTVNVKKATNLAWVHDLYMDVITEMPGVISENQWSSDMSYWDSLVKERTIKAVDQATNTITLKEPLDDSLDMKYGVSTVTKFSTLGRIENVGIENIQLISRFDKAVTSVSTSFGMTYKQYEDELHAQVGVRFSDAQNVWVRNYTTYHIDVAVTATNGVKWLTIQDANVLEPVSKTTAGERRYGFSISGGQLVLTQRAFARYPRHGYIVMGGISGPNVFYNSTATYSMDASEPHLRWSSGGLYDSMNARIYIQNRWNNGTAHGWAGVNYTLWNNNGPYIISQPPLDANYLFGQSAASVRVPFIMENVDPGKVPNFPAYEYSNGTAVNPASLYIQQLTDRLGLQAVAKISSSTVPNYMDESGTLNTYVPKLSGIYLDGQLINGFNPETTMYSVPIPLDYENLPVLTAIGENGSTVTITTPNDAAKSPFIIKVHKGTDIDGSYSVNYDIIPKTETITASNGSSSVINLIDSNKDTSWSASSNGGVWVRFYLGDTPKIINSVSIGFNKDTQNRRQYYFDIETSMDGINWTKQSNPAWQLDNLGNGHIMSHQVLPGTESSLADVETFLLGAPVQARLVRITGYGTRIGTGTGTATANSYFSMELGVTDGGTVDTIPPVWPVNSSMTASNVSPSGATLNWSAAADNIGVTRYKIYTVTGNTYSEIASLSSPLTQYNLTQLNPDTNYTFTVKAADGAGNWSMYGPSASIHTPTNASVSLVTYINLSSSGGSAIHTKGGTLQLSATVLPVNASNKSVTWSVYNIDGTATNLGTIDQNGLLTALLNGTVKVEAAAKDSSGVKGQMMITISGQDAAPALSATLLGSSSVNSGQTLDLIYGLNNGIQTVNGKIYAQDLTINYDPVQLEWLSVTPLLNGIFISKSETLGQVRIIAASEGSNYAINPNNSGAILKLGFKARSISQSATSAVTVSKVAVSDGDGIVSQAEGATYTVQIHVVDKAPLNALIQDAQALYNSAVEGNQPGQYPAGSKAILQAAIDKARAAAGSGTVSQEQVNQELQHLNASIQSFVASVHIALQGDLNGDNIINIGDLAIVASHYGETLGSPNWLNSADINKDGVIDIVDLAAVAQKIITP
ncbi:MULTISPECIES: discoidin domain-containing protein [unclassified Paenibacillus]|uniref:discoidin domain-containing protein n=1 Tax=unclassified Paenibacillus TaxID=185978 RepID=UPI0036400AA2